MQGALDRNGILPGSASFREGVIGKALFLEGGAVDCGNYPAYDATEGVSVDLWVYPTANASGTLVRRGEGLGLYLVRQGEGMGVRFELSFAAVSGSAATATPAGTPSAKPESIIVETRRFEARGAGIPVNRWTRILASYDKSRADRNVQIFVDFGRGPVEKLAQKEHARLAPSSKVHLYLGGGGGDGSSFRGGIDDVRVQGILGESYEPFPPQVMVVGPSRKLYFTGGKLDSAHHTLAQTLVIRYGKREKTLVIGTEGNIVSK